MAFEKSGPLEMKAHTHTQTHTHTSSSGPLNGFLKAKGAIAVAGLLMGMSSRIGVI